MRKLLLLSVLVVGACSAPGGPYPSLQPRPGEMVDPRAPVSRPVNDRPVNRDLESRLAALVDQASEGDAAFEQAASAAQHLADEAGGPQSESWITAEEALTAAIAARRPTAMALSDIDEIGARALEVQGGLAPSDRIAVSRAAAEVSAIERRQEDRIATIERRLRR